MMTPADLARVLAVAQSYDNRKVDEVVVESWHRLLGHLDAQDALTAVHRHYATSRDWLMPIDVLDGAKRIRRERLEALEVYTPDADPDDVQDYIAARREGRVRLDEPVRARDMRAIEGTLRSAPPASPAAIEAAKTAVPRPKPRPRPMTHAEAVADMDRMLAEQAHRDQAAAAPPDAGTHEAPQDSA